MTKKRFQKLARSEMSKLMAHTKGAGKCIKASASCTAKNFGNCMSYQECWDALRAAFSYGDNVPPTR